MDLLTDFMLLRFFFHKKKFPKNSLQTHKYNGIQTDHFFFYKETYARVATLAHSHTVFSILES